MNSFNPLIEESLRGHIRPGAPHLAYLNDLCLQGLVLLLWWPEGSVLTALEEGREPVGLLALVIALGATLAYYALRAGAEEILLPGQHPLREWALATPLGLGRILCGYLAGHLVQMLYAIGLSSPLLCIAFSVFGGARAALAWSLVAVVIQATCYRLAAAVVYTAVGHLRNTTLVSVRLILFAGYVVTGAFFPAMSHPVVSYSLLRGSGGPRSFLLAGIAVPDYLAFPLLYTVAGVALAALLYLLLERQRRLVLAAAGVEAG
jgi:hypothetical protein